MKPPKMFKLYSCPGSPISFPSRIPWSMAEEAYKEYVRRFGDSQSLHKINDRGGFTMLEMNMLFPAWREVWTEREYPRKALEKAKQEIEELKNRVAHQCSMAEEDASRTRVLRENLSARDAQVDELQQFQDECNIALPYGVQISEIPDAIRSLVLERDKAENDLLNYKRNMQDARSGGDTF